MHGINLGSTNRLESFKIGASRVEVVQHAIAETYRIRSVIPNLTSLSAR